MAAQPLGFTVDTRSRRSQPGASVGGGVQPFIVLALLRRRGALGRPRLGLPKRGTPAFHVFVMMGPTSLGCRSTNGSLWTNCWPTAWSRPARTYVYLSNRLLLSTR